MRQKYSILKKMIPLIDEENKSYKKKKVYYMFKKGFNTDENDKNALKLYNKVRYHCHYKENIEELLIVFVM